MLNKSLIVLLATGFVAAASAVATTPAAASSSSSISFSVYGPNFGFQLGHPYFAPRQQPRYVCTPTYKRIYYKYKGKTYSRLVQTGQSCHWVYPSPPRGPYPHQYRPY